MKPRLSASLIMTSLAIFHPWPTLAQQAQQPATPPQPPWYWHGPWHMWSDGWGLWWIFPLLFMLFMIIMCAVMFFLWRRSGGGHHHWGPWGMMGRDRSWGDPNHSALQILNERFAKGEIQKQEYEEKKAVILSGRQP